VIPLLRVFTEDAEQEEDAGPGQEGEAGEERQDGDASDPLDAVNRTFMRGSREFSATLDSLYSLLDRVDLWFADFFGIEGSPARRARVGALCTVTAWFVIVAVLSVCFNFLHLVLRATLVIVARVTLQNRLCENLHRQRTGRRPWGGQQAR